MLPYHILAPGVKLPLGLVIFSLRAVLLLATCCLDCEHNTKDTILLRMFVSLRDSLGLGPSAHPKLCKFSLMLRYSWFGSFSSQGLFGFFIKLCSSVFNLSDVVSATITQLCLGTVPFTVPLAEKQTVEANKQLINHGLRLLWPGGARTAVSISLDDGYVFDSEAIAILNQYELVGTFNLNSLTLGGHFFDFPIQKAEDLQTVYSKYGHEIASHSQRHEFPTLFPLTSGDINKMFEDYSSDREILSAHSHQDVCGFAYPFGFCSRAIISVLRRAGFSYARCGRIRMTAEIPRDWFSWRPNAHLLDGDAITRLKSIRAVSTVFLMSGHTYEWKWGNNEENRTILQGFKDFCEFVAGNAYWNACMRDVYRYWEQWSLSLHVTNRQCFNAGNIPLWFEYKGKTYKVDPAKCVEIG